MTVAKLKAWLANKDDDAEVMLEVYDVAREKSSGLCSWILGIDDTIIGDPKQIILYGKKEKFNAETKIH